MRKKIIFPIIAIAILGWYFICDYNTRISKIIDVIDTNTGVVIENT